MLDNILSRVTHFSRVCYQLCAHAHYLQTKSSQKRLERKTKASPRETHGYKYILFQTIVIIDNDKYCKKRTTIFKDMFRHAYAVISLIE